MIFSHADAEDLRAAFRGRYHNFQLLLSANNKALEIMTEMEHVFRGGQPFGMSFIRANATAASVNVFRIVKNLDQLAPGKYGELYGRFKEIQDEINGVFARRKPAADGRLVIPFRQINKEMADEVGNKMGNLGEVVNHLDLPVPGGFVVTASAYRRFFAHNDLQSEIERRLQSTVAEELDTLYELSATIQQSIIRAEIPEDLREEILNAYAELERGYGERVKVSMRSSALGEDSSGMSFAGQYRSELNVSPDSLLEAYKEIVAGKYSIQAISYRLNRGILDEDVAMCVGCMVMVDAVSGGVTYSKNPLNVRDDSVLINSVWGLPQSVVDGSVKCDRIVVARGEPLEIVERDIQSKIHKFVCYPEEGVCRMELTGEKSAESSLTDEQALAVARMALRLEEYYGTPQDVEWAVDPNGVLCLLQCRPLKQSDSAEGEERAPDRQPPQGEILIDGGITAGPGAGFGPVFVVKRNSDTLQFPQGAVLVVAQARPRWAALLNRASALITEQGSAAGHLANVAREFGVPALFGVTGATEFFQNGVDVTVDADGRRVYKGKIESLLEETGPKKNLMEGSPVYEILKEVVQYIVPLSLLDPESRDFKPKNCRTLHDITRFCHEKSVKEMFSFGKEHHFSERAAKQLVCDVPMLWWLINLDDGFREDVTGKFVNLDNIVSIPMLALWAGIVAVPWAGPPPVDSRGFMSILLEASANPELDPSMPSAYTNKNYFMISRNFCSLSSRFGFHFCTVEALVGDRAQENYVSFRFKGGAADFHRRLRRAHFVGSLLEEFDFRVEINDDGVFGKIDGFDEEVMKQKLLVVGYLLIHTRQLDMVMTNDTAVQFHRDKILSELHEILASPRAPGSSPAGSDAGPS